MQREPGDPGSPVDINTKQCTARAAIDAVRRAATDKDPNAKPEIKSSDGLLIWATPRKEQS